MSKLGRYAADRKKIQDVTATTSVAVPDCGTHFMMKNTAALNMKLPTVSDAGRGWWAKWVVTSTMSADAEIRQDTTDTADLVTLTVTMASASLHSSLPLQISADGFTMDNSACATGDTVELWTDGTRWYGQAIVSGGAGILKYDA